MLFFEYSVAVIAFNDDGATWPNPMRGKKLISPHGGLAPILGGLYQLQCTHSCLSAARILPFMMTSWYWWLRWRPYGFSPEFHFKESETSCCIFPKLCSHVSLICLQYKWQAGKAVPSRHRVKMGLLDQISKARQISWDKNLFHQSAISGPAFAFKAAPGACGLHLFRLLRSFLFNEPTALYWESLQG